MAKIAILRTPTQNFGSDLQAAYEEARNFPVEQAEALALSQEQLAALAGAEAAQPRIMVDARGFTAGMRLHIIAPAGQVLSEWKVARANFDATIAPFMADINSIEQTKAKIDKALQYRDASISQEEQQLSSQPRYKSLEKDYSETQSALGKLQAKYKNRRANEFVYNPIYWIIICSIGATEWLINYDVFYLFMGVPAIAAGATLIMGLLLALAAHEHGLLLKQWSHRFGFQRYAADRLSEWWILSLATFALLVVLLAAGGSRYEIVIRSAASLMDGNLAGVTIEANPLRDVSLSLLANVAAWLVGVFVAYMAHDVDPGFVTATRMARKSERKWQAYRAPTDDRIKTLNAQFNLQEQDIQATYESKMNRVKSQHDLLLQIDQHAQTIASTVTAAVTANVRGYRAALATKVLERGGQAQLFFGQREMTPYEFQAQRVDSHSMVS